MKVSCSVHNQDSSAPSSHSILPSQGTDSVYITAIGRVEKWKNDILKYADVDYYGTKYIKQGSIEKNRIFKILAGCFYVLKFWRTLYKSKKMFIL